MRLKKENLKEMFPHSATIFEAEKEDEEEVGEEKKRAGGGAIVL